MQTRDLGNFMVRANPGALVLVQVSTGQTYPVITGKSETNSSRAILGVINQDYHSTRNQFLSPASTYQLNTAFFWLGLILPNVALVNMLPLFPFDGDRYLDTLMEILGLKNRKPLRMVASVVSLGLLLSNIVLSYILFGTIFPR
ncbi:hypothetical protein E6H28_06605 [Candidatus Bathyarchaeota archaeon]|nr:MAG: hypothetical protein E6H28_06605 [Candidatus Bathyarchaeota archaeon]